VQKLKFLVVIKTLGILVPLLEAGVEQRPFNYLPYLSEEELIGHSHENKANVNDMRVKTELDRYNE
jgi:hypothetical protein